MTASGTALTLVNDGRQEDLALVAGHKMYGKKWKRIATRIGSRCGTDVPHVASSTPTALLMTADAVSLP